MATKNKSESNFFSEFLSSLATKRIRTIRLIVQIAFFIIINGVIIGLSKIPFPAPISFPAGAPYGTVWGGLDAIQFVLSSGNFPFLAFGIFFVTGAVFGRMTCGWVCPVGLWQDILAMFPLRKIKLSKENNRGGQFFGQMLLVGSLFLSILIGTRRARGEDLIVEVWTVIPFGVIDPAGTIFVTWFYAFFWNILPSDAPIDETLNTLRTLFVVKTIIVFLIAFISMKVPRAYCRWVCPTGALLAPMTKHSILTIKRNPVKCEDGCTKCESVCPMQVPILDESPGGIANEMCINCGDCVDACPDALSFGLRI